MLGIPSRSPFQPSYVAKKQRLLLLVVVLVVVGLLVFEGLNLLNHHKAAQVQKAAQAARTAPSAIPATGSVGGGQGGKTVSFTYPDNWLLKQDNVAISSGFESSSVTSPNGLGVVISTNMSLPDPGEEEDVPEPVGQTFMVGPNSYQLLAASSTDEATNTSQLYALYVGLAGSTSKYLATGTTLPDGSPAYEVIGIVNPTDGTGNYVYKTVQTLQADGDYPAALATIKSALAQ